MKNTISTNKVMLENLKEYVGAINKNVKELDNKIDNLSLDFAKLSTEITTERAEHEKVLSIKIWLIAILLSAGVSVIGILFSR